MNAKNGTVGWFDLTVPDAERVRDFYASVLGVVTSDVSMGEYSDYCLHPAAGEKAVAGVCHARGVNADVPPAWLIYFTVSQLTESLKECVARGGTILRDMSDMGSYGQMAIIRDPAGAVCALIQPRE